MFTLNNYILFGILLLAGIALTLSVFRNTEGDAILTYACGFMCLIIIILIIGVTEWVNTNIVSDTQAVNGIEREIRITGEDGREIFYYDGKVDVECNYKYNYITFKSEDGKRYTIYYGVQDTLTIIEK